MGAITALSVEGERIALILSGSWRAQPPPCTFAPEELSKAVPDLLAAGSGGLAWWRVRHDATGATESAAALRQAYRCHTLDAARQEMRIERVLGLLAGAGVEPLLAKGWAAARLYPHKGLRPYGDIDLWVSNEQYQRAERLFCSPGAPGGVDLHPGSPDQDRSWRELRERSESCQIASTRVRLLSAEDHLRLLCRHLLFHGGWRPMWLCDVAAAIERVPGDFDWDYCLAGPSRYREWVGCALALARELLGASLEGVPPLESLEHPPSWLIPSVLEQWGRREHYMLRPSFSFSLRHPRHLWQALRLRWPDPVLATLRVGAPCNEFPRLPFQLAECVRRTWRFLGPGDHNR